MRRARLTYQGAFHHGMNRGYDGRPIFSNIKEKAIFIELLAKNDIFSDLKINSLGSIYKNTLNRRRDDLK